MGWMITSGLVSRVTNKWPKYCTGCNRGSDSTALPCSGHRTSSPHRGGWLADAARLRAAVPGDDELLEVGARGSCRTWPWAGAHRPGQRVPPLRREDRRGSSSCIVQRSGFFFLKQRSSSLRSGLMLLLLLCPCRTAKVGVESTDGTSFSLPESQAVQPSTAAVLLLDSSYFNSILWQNVQRLGKIRAS